MVGGKVNANELIANSIDEAVANHWIGKTIPSSLKTKTKYQTNHVVKKLNTLVYELEKKNYGKP